MPVIVTADRSLFYFEYRVSRPAVPPLLLIHGAGGQHTHWPPQVRRMQGVRSFAPDLPGHGRSAGPGCSSVEDYAAILLSLMDALGIERFIPVGHSMGGAIALQLALAVPERAAGLVLVSTGARLRVAPFILDSVLSNYGAVVDFVIEHAYGPHASEDLRRLGRRVLKETPPGVTQQDYLACDTFDVMGRLPQIAAPALVMVGTEDRMTPPKYARHLVDHLPDARLHLIEGAGHMLPSEQPEALATLIRGWLATCFGL